MTLTAMAKPGLFTRVSASGYLELTSSLARILQTSLSPFLAASFRDLVTFSSSLLIAFTCSWYRNLLVQVHYFHTHTVM